LTGSLSQATVERSERLTSAAAAVSVEGLSKAFRLPHEKYSTVKERVVHPFAQRSYEVLPALRDVSFEVAQGEAFGIVGRNGSGKSTLLKCVSRIYRVDAGEVHVEGRLAPFIELGVGFNPDLSARDNAVANAVLLGLTPAQARERLNDIIAFAELEQFVDLKLKNFSSGMTTRLAFAVTIQVDADVLLFDEVLKVGDASFQEKCGEHFERLKDEGRTVLLVTHDMESIESFCDRAMLLEDGCVVDIGAPAAIARGYDELNAQAPRLRSVVDGAGSRPHASSRSGAPRGRSGPTMFGPDPRRLLTLTRVLAVDKFKVKYLDAELSYLWVLMGPLLFFAILYWVFTQIGNFDQGVNHYPLYLLSSLVLWMYFAEATGGGVACLVGNEALLRRLSFPHAAVPMSVVAMTLFDLCMSSIAVLVFLLASGLSPRLTWLEVVPIVLFLSVFITGLAMLLSALYVRYRDIDHVWTLLRQALFYASPIFYVVASVPIPIKPVVLANPLAAAFTQVRHAVIDPTAPTWVAASGGAIRALIPVAIVVGTFALGLWVFHRESPTVAENL
jgi:ABC-type polysaccharide/polyol phosphate transport system ATPase subunit/ABC-type polysaccharide/polyol phosphate export permease